MERGCCAPLHPCQSLRLLTCIGEEILSGQEEQKPFPTSHHKHPPCRPQPRHRFRRSLHVPDMDQDNSAEWSEGPSAALGGAGSKRQRTGAGDSDDVGDGEDADVSN